MHSSRMRTARSSSRLLGGGACLPQCMLGYTPTRCGPGDIPQLWAWRPPGCGPGDPLPGQIPSTSPMGVGLETPQARPLNFPPGCGPGDPLGQTPQLPPGCGPGDPSSPDPTTSPHPPHARPLNLPLGCGPGDIKACWDTTPSLPP